MTWLDRSLKKNVSEHTLTVNMLKDPKLLWNLHESTFIIFFITLRELDLRNISLSDILNLRGVSQHIDYQWQVSFTRLREFVVPDSNANIFKTKNIFYFSNPFLESIPNFKHFEKKGDRHSYFICEITDCQRLG